MLSLLIATPSILVQPLAARPALHQLALPRVAAVQMEEPEKLSVLDTTEKFDELAAGAALEGSAAEALGREPGTCDPYDPKSSEFCMDEDPKGAGLQRTIRLGVLFFAWYFLNTAYNIGNKLVLTAFPMPWTAATWELFFGFPYVFFLWTTGLRKAPKVSLASLKVRALLFCKSRQSANLPSVALAHQSLVARTQPCSPPAAQTQPRHPKPAQSLTTTDSRL